MTRLDKIFEAMRTSYAFDSSYKPVGYIEYKTDNGVEKVDAFQSLYYIVKTHELSNDDLLKLFKIFEDSGLHPVLLSTFFKFYFDIDFSNKFKYNGNLKEFPQAVLKEEYLNKYQDAYENIVNSRNGKFKEIAKILLGKKRK